MGYANVIKHVLDHSGAHLNNMATALIEDYIATIYKIKHTIYHEEVKLKDWDKLTKEERKDTILKNDPNLAFNYSTIDGLKFMIRNMNPSDEQMERIAHDNYSGTDWDKVVRQCDCNVNQ